MTIICITKERPACLGVMCPRHDECARYHAVTTQGAANAIGTCLQDNTWPLFVPRQAAEVPACTTL